MKLDSRSAVSTIKFSLPYTETEEERTALISLLNEIQQAEQENRDVGDHILATAARPLKETRNRRVNDSLLKAAREAFEEVQHG